MLSTTKPCAKTGDFSDASLIIIGHGSTRNAESAAPVYQHAAELRRRGIFAEVLEAFWKQEPYIAEVARNAASRRAFFAPLFISEGYFTEEAIPLELGFRQPEQASFCRKQTRGSQTWHYCAPAGTHESMVRIVLARALGVVEKHPFPRAPKPDQMALFIAGHGTERNENSRRAVEYQVEAIRSMRTFFEAHAVFMEEEPKISDCFGMTDARNLVVVPFFISDGLHSREDIPIMLGESEKNVRSRLAGSLGTWRNPTERKGKMVWYSGSVGTEPSLAEVILERVREAEQ
ncbi:MAG: hypothetical protein O2960_21065 [Verrucomicrobia bacterium]|nr:hypothetical protein [Verrucomicrobiota bacterium]